MAGTESSKAKERRRRRSPKSEISTLDQTIATLHYVHFVKYDDAVSFYDAVSDTIRRRGGNRGIFRKKGWIQWHILGEITDLEFENH